ncbi:LOW QUALITY PROTEIN: olfactory receptor 6K3 [Glossophaga mutica]
MRSGNLSVLTGFIFSGFLQFQDGGLLYFFLHSFIYTFIVIRNLMIFFALRLDTHLSNLMYNNYISIFSFLQMWCTTVTISNIPNLNSKEKTISFIVCLLMYIFHLGNTENLAIMAMNRSCHFCPPNYLTIIMPRLCAQLFAKFIFGFLHLVPEIVWILILSFCSPNQIYWIVCDFTYLLNLACMHASVPVQDVIHVLIILTTGLFLSYSTIIVILDIPSVEGCKKAFSNCGAHNIIFFVSLIYLRFSATRTSFWDTIIALTLSVLAVL